VNRIRVAIVLAQRSPLTLGEVGRRCAALGFHHELTLDSIGVLIGSAEPERLS
jgi:hypothetical protein